MKNTLLLLTALLFTGNLHAENKQEEVQLKKEPVILVEWERLEGAFRYRLMLEDVELGAGVGVKMFIQHDGPLDDLKVKAFTMKDEPLGETKLVSTEPQEKLVLRWNTDDYKTPFIGLLTSSSPGSTGRLVMELKESPHIIGSEPEHIVKALFGEGIPKGPDNKRIVPAPFEFEGREVIEHGPFITLQVP